MDNPCLSRSKDGIMLIMDTTSLECFANKSTLSYNTAKWSGTNYNGGNWSMFAQYLGGYIGLDLTKCYSSGYKDFVINIGGNEPYTYFNCVKKETIYYCPTNWIKLNNSTCQYREPF